MYKSVFVGCEENQAKWYPNIHSFRHIEVQKFSAKKMADSDASSTSSASSAEEQRPTKKIKKESTPSGPSSAPPLEIVPSSVSSSGNQNDHKKKQKIIVLLDQAKLETVKTRRGTFELLNCDDHRDLCRKWKKNPSDYRPDICHQELLALIDSPLNKAGHLQVYIKTVKNVLVEIHPSIRIPRTYKRFAGLIVQLLHKMKIKAGNNGSTTLMKVIKNPFSQYLPPGTRVFGMTCEGTLYSPQALARALVPEDATVDSSSGDCPPVCFVVGAMAAGHVTVEDYPYIEKMISVSSYPLSGAAALARILMGIEQQWGIF